MELETTVIPIRVGKTVVLARVAGTDTNLTGIAGEAKVAARIPNFNDVAEGIEEMTKTLVAVFERVRPDKVSVEFSVGISVEGGKMVALFFDTKTTGSVKVSLQWGKDSGSPAADKEGTGAAENV